MASNTQEVFSDQWLRLAMGHIPFDAIPEIMDPIPLGSLALFGAEHDTDLTYNNDEQKQLEN